MAVAAAMAVPTVTGTGMATDPAAVTAATTMAMLVTMVLMATMVMMVMMVAAVAAVAVTVVEVVMTGVVMAVATHLADYHR